MWSKQGPLVALLTVSCVSWLIIPAAGQTQACNPPCQNGGTCFSDPTSGSLSCLCSTGWTGATCTQPLGTASGFSTPSTQATPPASSSSGTSTTSQNTSTPAQTTQGQQSPPSAACNPACAHGKCVADPTSGQLSCNCDGSGYTGTYCTIPVAGATTTPAATTPAQNTSTTPVQNTSSPTTQISSPPSPAAPSTPPTTSAACNPACAHGTCVADPTSGQLSCNCDGSGYTGTYCDQPLSGFSPSTTNTSSSNTSVGASPPASPTTFAGTFSTPMAPPPPSAAASPSGSLQCIPACTHGVCVADPTSGQLSCNCDGTGYTGAYCSVPSGGFSPAANTSSGNVSTAASPLPAATYSSSFSTPAAPPPPPLSAGPAGALQCNPACVHGTCYQLPTTLALQCLCDTGYTGPYCDQSTTGASAAAGPTPAQTTPSPANSTSPPPPAAPAQCLPACQNGGLCYLQPNTASLSCNCDGTGYTGDYCTVPVSGSFSTGSSTTFASPPPAQVSASPPPSAPASSPPPVPVIFSSPPPQAPAPPGQATCVPPCYNGGVCYQDPSTQSLSCSCPQLWSGPYCTVPITGVSSLATANTSTFFSNPTVTQASPRPPPKAGKTDVGMIVGVAIGAAVGAAMLVAGVILGYQHFRQKRREGSSLATTKFALGRQHSAFEKFVDEPGREVTLTPTSSKNLVV